MESGRILRFEASVSFLQIYNEQLLDLLSLDQGRVRKSVDSRSGAMGTGLGFQKDLALRWNTEEEFYVNGLTRRSVTSASEAMAFFGQGIAKRVTASHAMNAASSRSHCMFTLDLKMALCSEGGEKILCSRINLVDLAGSERVAKTG